MLDAVRVARDVAVEVLVEQPLRRTLLLAQTATGHEIGRRLQLAAHPHEIARKPDILLDGPIASLSFPIIYFY